MSGSHGHPLDGDADPDGHRRQHATRSGLSVHDRRRLRASYRTAIAGVVLGVVGAAAIGWVGASGRAGAAVLLVLTSAGCMAAALVTAVLAMVDEYRHIPVGRPRTLAALWFFLGSALLLIMSTGVVAG
jgi:hypothetical protein